LICQQPQVQLFKNKGGLKTVKALFSYLYSIPTSKNSIVLIKSIKVIMPCLSTVKLICAISLIWVLSNLSASGKTNSNTNKTMTENIEWLKPIIQILSGGALGAIITLTVANYRNRVQPIGYKLSIDPVFFPNMLTDKSITKITFSGQDKVYDFENLFSATIKFQNIGNKDLTEFIVGISVKDDISILRADIISQDRHHIGKNQTDLSYDNLKSELDVEFKPLNRNDLYEIKLLLTIRKERIDFDDITFSSPSPVKFKALSFDTIGKFGLEVAGEILKRFP
jgi:hypothetical protein